eukprot:jgi/Hompol1/5757/HPOL_004681-RA
MIYFMVRDFGVSDDDRAIGFYVGALASSFCVAQLFSSLPWGLASDRWGRKPIILIGLVANATTCALFGMSETYTFALFLRTLCGLFNGNVGIIKAVIGEITDSTNRGQAFAYWEAAFGIGTIFDVVLIHICAGPVLGGLLVNPAEQYPGLFGKIELFKRFPYLFPCLVSAVISLIGAALGYVYLEETLNRTDVHVKRQRSLLQMLTNTPSKSSELDLLANCESHIQPHREDDARVSVQTLTSAEPDLETIDEERILTASIESPEIYDEIRHDRVEARTSIADLHPLVRDDGQRLGVAQLPESQPARVPSFSSVLTRNVIFAVSSYAIWSFLNVLHEEIYALFLATAIASGGLQFTSFDMGVLLSLLGVAQTIGQLVIYPVIERRYGYVGTFRISAIIVFVFSVILPFVGDLAHAIVRSPDGSYTREQKYLVFGVLFCVLGFRVVGVVMGYVSVIVLVNDAAPGKHALGVVHGFGQIAASFVRFVHALIGTTET